jgi:hypothetical protein
MNMYLNDTILNVIKQNLHSGWVSEYNWIEEFATVYCSDWFYTASDCFYAIENDASLYSNMLYFNTCNGYEYTNTVDMFNAYVYLFALNALKTYPSILEQIHQIRRVQEMRKSVPLVLNRVMQTDMIHHVKGYLGCDY